FEHYPERNARAKAEQWNARPRSQRAILALIRRGLKAAGDRAAIGEKAVLGSRSDRVFVMDERQRQIHREAGVPADRIAVTGAPFIDEILEFRDRFDAVRRAEVRKAIAVAREP